jgi:hypothetical protein
VFRRILNHLALKADTSSAKARRGDTEMMVPSSMLFAVETFPLLVYIFMALVVLSVPAFAVWEKVIRPQIDAKRKAEEEAEEAVEAAVGGEEPVIAGEMESADVAGLAGMEGVESPEGVEGAEVAEGAEPAAVGEGAAEVGDEPQAEVAAPAAEGEGGQVAFEEAVPPDMFTEEESEKPPG